MFPYGLCWHTALISPHWHYISLIIPVCVLISRTFPRESIYAKLSAPSFALRWIVCGSENCHRKVGLWFWLNLFLRLSAGLRLRQLLNLQSAEHHAFSGCLNEYQIYLLSQAEYMAGLSRPRLANITNRPPLTSPVPRPIRRGTQKECFHGICTCYLCTNLLGNCQQNNVEQLIDAINFDDLLTENYLPLIMDFSDI